LIEDVLAHRLEGAFVCGPVDHPELEEEFIFREELVVLSAPAAGGLDELVSRGDLKIVVLRAGCSYRQRLEDILAKRGVVGLRRLEFGTLEAILSCVAAGLGVTLLPRSLLGPVRRDRQIAVHELPKAEALVDTIFVRRRDAFASSALAAFLQCARPAQAQADAAQ
jgi:DNA-binding transcriptional LysR family regulator